METVTKKPLQDRNAIPLGRGLILSFILITLMIRGDLLPPLMKRLRLDPLLLIAILRIIAASVTTGMALFWGYDLSALGLAKKNVKRGIKHGILWCAGFGFFVCILGIGLYMFGINPFSLFSPIGHRSIPYLIMYYCVGCIIGPVVEDLIFTGLLYNSLRTRLNLIPSILLVAVLFALCHGYLSLFLIIQFTGGVMFALSFEFSHSLLTPMIIHICANLAITTIQVL